MKYLLLTLLASYINAADPSSPLLGDVGVVMNIKTGADDRDKALNAQLHFCLFNNGKDDYIYAGTKYGMWSSGEFVVSYKGIIVGSYKVPGMVYGGVIIKVGDLVKDMPAGNSDWYVTKVDGYFK